MIRKKFPEKKISTAKRGFTIPLATWMREQLKEPISDILLSANHAQDFGLKHLIIKNMLNDHLNKKANYHWPLFTIYSLFKWNQSRVK